MSEAYFEPTAEGLSPVAEARGPWSADMLHGRLLSGLAARAVEADLSARGVAGLRLARLTVDLFRAAPLEPIQITTGVVRSGQRVQTVEVAMTSGAGGSEIARAHAVLLRTGLHPGAEPWHAARWDGGPPDDADDIGAVSNGDGWDIRVVTPGGFWTNERKRVWTRDRWQLVLGEELSPTVRAALAADLPNPLANSTSGGLDFINADLTMTLSRPPTSDWIGLEVSDQQGADGLAIGLCTLYDVDGAIGWSAVCSVAAEGWSV